MYILLFFTEFIYEFIAWYFPSVRMNDPVLILEGLPSPSPDLPSPSLKLPDEDGGSALKEGAETSRVIRVTRGAEVGNQSRVCCSEIKKK